MYPREFCREVCRGIDKQRRVNELGLMSLPILNLEQMEGILGDEREILSAERKHDCPDDVLHDSWAQDSIIAFDDVSGEALDLTC